MSTSSVSSSRPRSVNACSRPRVERVESVPGAVALLAPSRSRAAAGARGGPVGLVVVGAVLALDRQLRLARDPVGHAEQPVVEPAVLGALVRGAGRAARPAVAAVVEPELARDAAVGEPVPPLGERLRLDVPVVEPVDDEHAGADALDLAQVVARLPERAPVAGRAVLLLEQALQHVGARGLHARGDEVRQHVGVLAEVGVVAGALGLGVRRHDQPVGAVVVVPARDRRDGDDRLQALDAGGRHLVGQRAVVGDAGHADGAGRPVGRRPRLPASSKPRARPLSQSITALVPSVSHGPPTSGQPSELNVPMLSPSTTA